MKNYQTVTLSILPNLKSKLDVISKKLNVPRSVLVRKAIVEFLKTAPKKGDFTKTY